MMGFDCMQFILIYLVKLNNSGGEFGGGGGWGRQTPGNIRHIPFDWEFQLLNKHTYATHDIKSITRIYYSI